MPVRIRSTTLGFGQVEILSKISWLPVCADRSWDINTGNVVCRQLGFPAAENVVRRADSDGIPKTNVWRFSIHCKGTEESVYDCSMRDNLHVRCHNFAEVKCKSGNYDVDHKLVPLLGRQHGDIKTTCPAISFFLARDIVFVPLYKDKDGVRLKDR